MKVYKGYELIKEIAEGNIKNGTKIEIMGRFSGNLIGSYFIYQEGEISHPIYKPNGEEYLDEMKLSDILNFSFRIIEDQTIDIESIEEMEKFIYVGNSTSEIKVGFNRLIDKQNEILRAVKHLNKEIQSIKEK